MPKCGSKICICDLPIRFDTYEGCTHACKYCFVQRKKEIDVVGKGESANALAEFIKGKRNSECNWCDWDIPIHFGGCSDPFQPIEKKYQRTLQSLEVLKQTKYPVVISTKGKLCIEQPYISLLKECNVVMQVSMACSKYDVLEQGAPTFEERLNIVKVLSENVKRVNIRVQPYMHECYNDIKQNIKRFADAGAYGVIFEGMKFAKKKKGLVKVGGDFTYPVSMIRNDFKKLKDECHKYGLKFYSGENRTRKIGDSLTCCGIDGLEGFTPNLFNGNHILAGEKIEPTENMKKVGTCQCFKSMYQDSVSTRMLKRHKFSEQMMYEIRGGSNARKALGYE